MHSSIFRQFENVLILDTETTGIDFRHDEIIELAALRVHNGEPVEEMDMLIRLSPGRRLSPEIVSLTGITEQMLMESGVERSAACIRFSEMLEHPDVLISAYNAQFDLCFLYYFLNALGMADVLKNRKFFDALTVYKDRRDYPHKLANAVEQYSLVTQNTHRAIDDAKATYELMLAMEREKNDLTRYINLFGYNPKYGVSGPRISSVSYSAQRYSEKRPLYEL